MRPEKDQFKSLAHALEDHSAEGIAILSSQPAALVNAIISLLFALLLAALAWSFFGKADVTVKAEGKLAPESGVRRVYSPIDGELVDVFMSEGMPVSKGDVIARVDSPVAVQAATKTHDAELKLLDAEEKYRLFPTEKKAMEQQLALLDNQIQAAEQMQEKRIAESIAKLAEEQKLKLAKAQGKLEKARRERDHAKAVWEQHVRLYNSPGGGGVSAAKVAEKRNDYFAKIADYQLAETELGEFEVGLNKEYAKQKEEIQKQYENLLSLRVQYHEQLAKLEQAKAKAETTLRMARLEYEGASRVSFKDIDEDNFLRILAPVSGVIANADVNQVGDKVEPKKPLVGIAPEGSRRILELEIAEADRGFLKEGMPVKVKFNAFPYQRYGIIEGTLEYISPTTTFNEQTKKYVYKGRVGLDRLSFAIGNAHFPLRYGMSAMAEIIVRQRRLIDMALDPFRKVAG